MLSTVLPDVSVIVPTLDESPRLRAMAEAVLGNDASLELIVVDGGSQDDTVELARELGFTVVESGRRNRAYQMNRGAAVAKTDVFLFLHADTLLPKQGIDDLLDVLGDPKTVGGAFIRRFDSPSPILQFSCRLAAIRSRTLGLFLGDQAIFVRRSIFEQIGGFDETRTIGEDLDFSRRMRQSGPVAAVGGPAISSSRRFEKHGPILQSMIDFWLALRILTSR